MKKSIVAVIGLSLALATSGCGSWITQFKTNPVLFVDDFNAKTDIIVTDATTTFNDALAFAPAEKQAELRSKWAQCMTALTAAKKALRNGVDAAVAAGQAQPDWSRLVADVVSAVTEIVKIIDVVKNFGSASTRTVGAAQDPFYVAYVAKYGHTK